ncbi:MAG: hypothetical protein HFF71_13485 [Oscillospiraceae bacterium]|nr:hypothetical protein [Oscillospiraceae bacterium]
MAELREAHLRYLLAIYELGKSNPDVGTQAVAKALNCSKASVTKMMAILMDMNLLVREKYGKIYLTDTGFLLAKDINRFGLQKYHYYSRHPGPSAPFSVFDFL